jgi:hypothetical protein
LLIYLLAGAVSTVLSGLVIFKKTSDPGLKFDPCIYTISPGLKSFFISPFISVVQIFIFIFEIFKFKELSEIDSLLSIESLKFPFKIIIMIIVIIKRGKIDIFNFFRFDFLIFFSPFLVIFYYFI